MRPQIDEIRRRGDAGPLQVKPFTLMAGDDAASKPYQFSHAVWAALGHAADDLVAVYDSTVQQQTDTHFSVVTRPYAIYPVLRAGFENACRALWLLGGHDRQERVRRRLRMVVEDARMFDEIAVLSGLHPGGKYKADLERVKPIGKPLGISATQLRNGPKNAEVVRGGSEATGVDPNIGEVLWRCLSGMSHGDNWAMLNLLDREEIESDGVVVTMRTTSAAASVASFLGIVSKTTILAMRRYEEHATRQFPLRP